MRGILLGILNKITTTSWNSKKKLIDKPKRLKRKEEWESDSGKKGQLVQTDVPQGQRFSIGRIQHYDICRQMSHRKNTSSGKDGGQHDFNKGQDGQRDFNQSQTGKNGGQTSENVCQKS